MFKTKKSKLLLSLFLIIALISPFCFADNEVNTETDTSEATVDESAATTEQADEEAVEDSTEETQAEEQQNIHEGDLYLSGDKVTMDQLVNGNVYIMGNDVTITGQVAGNLFVLANKATFTDAYIESSVYLCAKEAKFQAIASDMYVCCNKLEIPTNYGVYRDLNYCGSSLTLLGIIGRNASCTSPEIILNKDESKATIYGNLNYNSIKEIEIPEGSVEGEVKYNQVSDESKSNTIKEYIIKAVTYIVFVLVIYGLSLLFAKGSIEKCTKIISKKSLLAFGVGLLGLIIIPIISFLLLISIVGLPLSFALLVFYGLVLAISSSVFTISLANLISEKAKISNGWLKALCVLVISLIVYIIGIIPYVSIIKFLLIILGFGILLMNMFFKNIKFEKKSK